MGNAWPMQGHRRGAQAFKPSPGYPGYVRPSPAQVIPFPRPPVRRPGGTGGGFVRYGRWMRPGIFGPLGGLVGGIAGQLIADQVLEPAQVFVVPPGWDTQCQTDNPLLQNNPQWPVWPGANACGFGGAVVPGFFDLPPPPGYEGYGSSPTWESWIPTGFGPGGYRAGIITPSKALENESFQIWFHYWYGYFVTPDTTTVPELPSLQYIIVPVENAWEMAPAVAPQVERGPLMRPWPIGTAWPTPRAPGIRFPAPVAFPQPVPGPVLPPGLPGPNYPPVPEPEPKPPVLPRPLPRAKWLKETWRDAPTREPPPPPVRERGKYIWQSTAVGKVVAGGLNLVTEAADLMEAAWFALPKSSRRDAWRYFGHAPTILERWLWTAQNTNKIDPEQLVKNLAMNQLGDLAGGISGKVWKKTVQDIYKYTGMNKAMQNPARLL